MYHVKCDQKAF